MLEFLKAPILILQFSYYDLPDDVICDFAIYADDTTLYSKCDQASDLWQEHELASELNLIYETLWTEVRSGLLILVLGKTQLVLFDHHCRSQQQKFLPHF